MTFSAERLMQVAYNKAHENQANYPKNQIYHLKREHLVLQWLEN